MFDPLPSVSESAPRATAPLALKENLTLVRDDRAGEEVLRPRLYPGTRRSAGNRLFARGGNTEAERRVALNFNNVEIAEAAGVVLGDVLDVNYTIDPEVKGKVRLQSTEPVPVSAVLGILETALSQNNAVLVVNQGVYRVIPAAQALASSSLPRQTGAGHRVPPGFSIRIVPLRYIPAGEMSRILEPFVSNTGLVRVDESRNILLLASTRPELELWLQTIETFDLDWFANKSVGIFPLQETTADVVIKELERIFAGIGESAKGSTVQFMLIERLNAVMAIALDPSSLSRVQTWVERLDAGSPTGRRLYVYRMKHGVADNLAPLLNQLFNPNASQVPLGGAGPQPAAVAPGLARKTMTAGATSASTLSTSGVPSTTSSSLMPNQSLAGQPEGGLVRPGIAGPAVSSAGAPYAPAGDGVQILSNGSSNTLIIRATASEYRSVLEALRKLDVPPLQVLVEATVAEVTITEELRYGMQYFLDSSDIFGQPAQVILSNSSSATQILPDLPGFSAITGAPPNAILDALDGVTEVKVVSSPNLMVLDNQTASLIVGDEIPVAVQQQQSIVTDDSVVLETIEFRNTGVIFQVTPRINVGGTITLNIVQEVSSVRQSTTEATLTPTISQRRIESSVVTESGETVVLGGLFSESRNNSKTGLPFLARLPLLGWLFGTTRKSEERTELVVLISPRVVSNQSQARMVTQELRNRVRDLERTLGNPF